MSPWSSNLSEEAIDLINFVSSAYKYEDEKVTFVMSFVHMRKSRRPSGTPESKGSI